MYLGLMNIRVGCTRTPQREKAQNLILEKNNNTIDESMPFSWNSLATFETFKYQLRSNLDSNYCSLSIITL